MILIYSLIFAIALSLFFTESIKKHYYIYYSFFGLIAVITSIYEILRITSNAKLYGLVLFLEKMSMRGYVSISFFILVMYAGALSPKWKITRKLLSIRAQLAVIGSILMLPHGIIYFIRFIYLKLPKYINEGNLPIIYISYIIVGIIGFIIMIPLFVTSLKKVRSKMLGVQWKKLQKWAYVFYFLAYIHILLILLDEKEIDWLRLNTYTIIFVGYAALRVLKYKHSKQSKLIYSGSKVI